MAILRSLDGQFYEIPDDQVSKFLIPADKVKEKLDAAGAPASPPSGPPPGSESGPPPGSPTILVQIFGTSALGSPSAPPPTTGDQGAPTGEVQPYHYWNNWWHNVKPGWNNWWHNVHN